LAQVAGPFPGPSLHGRISTDIAEGAMVAVEDVLTDSVAACIGDWFQPVFHHSFLGVNTIRVPDSVKPIPKRWVDDIEIGELGAEDGDVLGVLNCPSSNWSSEEGRRQLRESLARLELSEDHVAHRDLNKMNKHELAGEKRRIKQELKRYDAEFRKQFMRLPTHTEKEPMRPLYVYYRRLKSMITLAEQNKRRSSQSDDEASGQIGNPRRDSLATIPDIDETPRNGRSANVEDQREALEARIESLQAEKGVVRTKLQAFQEKFVSENNRKIRFHKDILPIEKEYRMYKNLKEEIQKAEAQLRNIKE